MSSLVWPWPERMVSGLKPTKLSWLAVVQKKSTLTLKFELNDSYCDVQKTKRKRQAGPVFGCPKFVLWKKQLMKGARLARSIENQEFFLRLNKLKFNLSLALREFLDDNLWRPNQCVTGETIYPPFLWVWIWCCVNQVDALWNTNSTIGSLRYVEL